MSDAHICFRSELGQTYSRFIEKASAQFMPLKYLFSLHNLSSGPGYFKTVEGDNIAMISGHSNWSAEKAKTISAGGSISISSQSDMSLTTNLRMVAAAEGEVIIMARKKISLRCGKAELTMREEGHILISGTPRWI